MKKRNLALLAASAALIGTGAAYLDRQNNSLKTEAYCIKKGLFEPITIVSLADLHGKRFDRVGNNLLSIVRSVKPDIVVFPGDTVSYNVKGLAGTARLISEVAKFSKVFMIPGNHEHRSSRLDEIMDVFRESGAVVLENDLCQCEIKGTTVNILGLSEQIGISRVDYLRAAMGKLEYPDNSELLLELAQKDGVKIVLSHFPETFGLTGERSYRRYDFDLMLAGHAHGGQIRLPVIGGLFAPGQGILPRYTSGKYSDGPALIVSRGLGNDSFIPRVNNRPEVSVITIM